jgi:hypothetical protein
MRDETRRKLDQVMRRQRLKIAGLALTGIAGVAALAFLTDLDTRVEDTRVGGEVASVTLPTSASSAARSVSVDVALADGRHVHVTALKEHEPHVGDHVTITEHRHATGRVTYSWR